MGKILRPLSNLIALAILTCSILLHPPSAAAQAQEVRKPIDMMIVIDNSCSMFPRDQIPAVCQAWGNDPDFLRIVGADLFAARLGFAEINADEYQIGVVSLGKSPRLVVPLQPLDNARDAVAEAIANPTAETATGIIPALKMAYKELRESPARKPDNLPAIVLITDGIPYPRQGQSNAEIEQLVKQNPDIPLFIMLLQNPNRPSADYQQYIRFWEQLQNRYTHVFVYRIQDAEQIEDTYNDIIAQLHNTIPTEGIGVAPDSPLQVFVSRYVRRIVVTVIHERQGEKGNITILDPQGQPVLDSDPGVDHFRGTRNPVEVISIFAPRLREDLKEDYWTITSDRKVIVFLDRQGAYHIHFIEPAVSLTDISNIYLATDRHPPSQEFVIRFDLLDENQQAILDPQPIQGKVVYPDGQEVNLRLPADLKPDAAGVYEIRFDFASAYPPVLNRVGRFTFSIDAGSADDRAAERIPIANAKLLVDVGRGCYIQTITPQSLLCTAGQPAGISVTLGDYDACRADTIQVHVLAGGEEIALTPDSSGTFSGDVTNLCTPLLTGVACSTQQASTLQVRMTGQLADSSLTAQSEQAVPVQVVAPTCTPTPTPSPTLTPTPAPTPTPTPTPCPDRDRDGFNDCGQDECPDQPGIAPLHGCPIAWWMWLLGGLLLLALIAFVWFWLWPRVRIILSPPPHGIVTIKSKVGEIEKNIYSIGRARHTNKVTIGSSSKADIRVAGLKPIEFIVKQQGDKVMLLDANTGKTKGFFKSEERPPISTSDSGVTLRIRLPKETSPRKRKPEHPGSRSAPSRPGRKPRGPKRRQPPKRK